MDPGFVTNGPFWSFRFLNYQEVNEFRTNARVNYVPFTEIEGIWHPVYQMECVLINHECSYYKIEDVDERDPRTGVMKGMEGDTSLG